MKIQDLKLIEAKEPFSGTPTDEEKYFRKNPPQQSFIILFSYA